MDVSPISHLVLAERDNGLESCPGCAIHCKYGTKIMTGPLRRRGRGLHRVYLADVLRLPLLHLRTGYPDKNQQHLLTKWAST